MYIWKIDGVPEGVWVKSETGTNYCLIPEGDTLRVMNIDNGERRSFNITGINKISSDGDKIIIDSQDGGSIYLLGLHTEDLTALNEIRDHTRTEYINCITDYACMWLSKKMEL